MGGKAIVTNPLKAWLGEFRFSRLPVKVPTKRPLYTYQVSEQEYKTLGEVLRQNKNLLSKSLETTTWGACFSLFVSEYYRREYSSSWSWKGPESLLGIELSPQKRAELTERGLKYWGRTIRQRARGHDWLGSLFSEGGLPWILVQSDTHGFGRAVRSGIRLFYVTQRNRRTIGDLMGDFERGLPDAFHNLETRQLLAGIVEQIMYLVENHPLTDLADPSNYLDMHVPGWRSNFPIPLDESNARTLINDWLRDAGQKRRERQKALDDQRGASCEHYLEGILPDWGLSTELSLPSEVAFAVDVNQIATTRLEVGIYEGDRLVARGGMVYGQVHENELKIRFPNPQISLRRRDPAALVSLRLLESGRSVHVIHFDDSALDLYESPAVFELAGDQWRLASTASCKLVGNSARIRVPLGFSVESKSEQTTLVAREPSGATWIDVIQDVSLGKDKESFEVELNQADGGGPKLSLVGASLDYESSPNLVFLGWPKLEIPDEYPYTRDELRIFANGSLVDAKHAPPIVGVVRYRVRTLQGKTMLQRSFGVVPNDFRLSMHPEVGDLPARLQVRSKQELGLKVSAPSVKAESNLSQDGGYVIYIRHAGNHPPADLVLEVGDERGGQTLGLRLTYPYQGARLLSADNQPSSARELIIDELSGLRVALTAGYAHGETFHLVLELVCQTHPHPKRHYVIHVGESPVALNLFSYQHDILQMLGAVDEQDAYVRLAIETQKRLLNLNLRRYNGRIEWEGPRTLAVRDIDGLGILQGATVESMLISDPRHAPLRFEEKLTQGVGTSTFDLATGMDRKGPWLIYPAKESPVHFRPLLYATSNAIEGIDREVHSLHRAAELFHPVVNPDVIAEQIESMAVNLDHSGWQYLSDLKVNFAHLPLSSFESWLALSRNVSALSLAVFRLELDEAFCARIRNELAIVWESIPLVQWVESYRVFRLWLQDQGLPETLVFSLETNRSAVLRSVVSGFDYLGNYLADGDTSSLIVAPIDNVLPVWYQQMRNRHADNRQWPTELGNELSVWIDRQNLPPVVKALSLVEFTDAVTYLPIFMAHITAGLTHMTVLSVPLSYLKYSIRCVSDFDRQDWYTCVHAMMVSYLLGRENKI